MKLSLLAAASVAALAVGAGTASAQYPVLVPHRNHYHVVPAYPVYPSYGYGYRPVQPGFSFSFNYGSPRVYAPAYGGWGGGYRSGWGGNNWGGYGRGPYRW